MRAIARSIHQFRSALRRQTCNYSTGFVRRRKLLTNSYSGLAHELSNNAKFDRFPHPANFGSRALSVNAVQVTNGDASKGGPLVEYERRIAAGELVDGDACQVSTLTELQRLYDELVQSADACRLDRYTTSRKSGRSRWLWSRFIPQSSNASPVKGLYLYGGVGTGKTMLMDLFFDQLSFTRNYLSGNIPLEWASTKLQNLSLTVNNLSGTIPAYLGNITTLKLLFLDSNQFYGTVPPELGKLVNLERLLLGQNNLRRVAIGSL